MNSTGVHEELKGRHVRFHLGDVFLLDPTAIGQYELEGKVVDLSTDSRGDGALFAIIEVRGLSKPCIVSVDRILVVDHDREDPGEAPS